MSKSRTIIGVDTATTATVAGLICADGRSFSHSDRLADPDHRPRHAEQTLKLLEQLLELAQLGWSDVDTIAVGVGPGGFTGLRIGISTARALAQTTGMSITPVSTLAALAAPAHASLLTSSHQAVVSVIDARRNQVFAAAWAVEANFAHSESSLARSGSSVVHSEPLIEPQALMPLDLAQLLTQLDQPVTAVGDGALRYRAELEAIATVPVPESPLHQVNGVALCRLAAALEPVRIDLVVPDYCRAPDATPPQLAPFTT